MVLTVPKCHGSYTTVLPWITKLPLNAVPVSTVWRADVDSTCQTYWFPKDINGVEWIRVNIEISTGIPKMECESHDQNM